MNNVVFYFFFFFIYRKCHFCHKKNRVYSTTCPPSQRGLMCTCSPELRNCRNLMSSCLCSTITSCMHLKKIIIKKSWFCIMIKRGKVQNWNFSLRNVCPHALIPIYWCMKSVSPQLSRMLREKIIILWQQGSLGSREHYSVAGNICHGLPSYLISQCAFIPDLKNWGK